MYGVKPKQVVYHFWQSVLEMSITIEVGFNYLPTCTEWTFLFVCFRRQQIFSQVGTISSWVEPVLSLALENKTVTPLSLELTTFDTLV